MGQADPQTRHLYSTSKIYNLLARHGWCKLMPRPFRPNHDIAAQSAFKKGFPNAMEQARRAAHQTWLRLAHHVRRRSVLWPYEPLATVLGSSNG
jgi:Winged helix-turn helix